jgi:hypothetical protein
MSRPRFYGKQNQNNADDHINTEDPIQMVIDKVKKRLKTKDKLVFLKIKPYNH